jgi:hypothetical protein
MKITIELEFDDDFEPCAYGCDRCCPFECLDDEYNCVHLYRNNDSDWSCPVKDAVEKGRENE